MKYPYIGIYRPSFTVCFFTEEYSGYVIDSNIHQIGEYSTLWVENKFVALINYKFDEN